MGCMMPSVEGQRENRTEEGTPYVVGLRAGERRDCSGQALETEGSEWLRGALLFRSKVKKD